MSDHIFVATRKGLFRLDRSAGSSGPSWAIAQTAFVGDPVSMVLPDPLTGRVYAAIGHGHFGVKLHRSEDDGVTWSECAAPKYPARPEGTPEDRCPNRGIPIPWNVELIWSLETGGRDQPGVLWCGTIPGGLFRSDDGGDSWALNESLWQEPSRREWFGGGMDYPGIHSICVDPRDDRHITVAVSCGGVWDSPDAGETWTCRSKGMWASYMPPERREDPVIQDAHRIVQCAAHPEVFWCQHHNGIFRSLDGAESWHEFKSVRPSTFGLAVAVHPHDPETVWFVPAQGDECRVPVGARMVVTRSRNGGETFDVLSDGLPGEHAYDLVFRHGLDVDDTGDALVVGSTTGSLWVSANQGDAWATVSRSLPPIYCVRFTGG